MLDRPKREKLKQEYKLKPSSRVEVVNNRIARDGITEEDLARVDKAVLADALDIEIVEKEPEQKTTEPVKTEEVTEIKAPDITRVADSSGFLKKMLH